MPPIKLSIDEHLDESGGGRRRSDHYTYNRRILLWDPYHIAFHNVA